MTTPTLTRDEIMDALWGSQYGYCEDKQPGDHTSWIDDTYNFDAFARAVNALVAAKIVESSNADTK